MMAKRQTPPTLCGRCGKEITMFRIAGKCECPPPVPPGAKLDQRPPADIAVELFVNVLRLLMRK